MRCLASKPQLMMKLSTNDFQLLQIASQAHLSSIQILLNLAPCNLLKLSMEQVKLFLQTFFVENKLRDRFLNCSFIFVKVRDRLFYSTFAFESKASSCFCIQPPLPIKMSTSTMKDMGQYKNDGKKICMKIKVEDNLQSYGCSLPSQLFCVEKIAFNKMTPIDLPKVAIFQQTLKNLVQIITGWNPYHFFHEIFAKFHWFFVQHYFLFSLIPLTPCFSGL